jgi:hypothetical protein
MHPTEDTEVVTVVVSIGKSRYHPLVVPVFWWFRGF